MSYYKDSNFENWLKINGDKQPKQSRGYIDSLVNNVLNVYKLQDIIDHLDKAIKQKEQTIAKLKALCSVLKKAACLNAPTLNNINGSISSIQQWCSVFSKYISFLEQTEPNSQTNKNWGAQQWNSALSTFWTNAVKSVSVDGYTSLLNAPQMNGSVDAFVKLAVENSYFFNATEVKNQHKYLIGNIGSSTLIFARKSSNKNVQKILNGQLVFCENNITIPIIKDYDGNKAVRDLIKNTTGYTVSSGYDNFFTNFKISHIWGNAYDPRYFTSLWNIVLVPAWANDILDKTNSNSILAIKMVNTFKAICEKLYSPKNYWSQLNISPTMSNHCDVALGNYTLNVIRNKGKQPIGTIAKQKITLS